MNVLRARLGAHQKRVVPVAAAPLGLLGAEGDLAGGGAGGGGEAAPDHGALGVGIEGRMQQLVERVRLDAADRLLARDQPVACHVDGDLERRLGGALAVARLQHPQLAALDGELHVLHVAVMGFQPLYRRFELGEGVRHGRLERGELGVGGLARRLGEVLRGANAGYHVLALRVDEELAVERLLAGRGVTGEGDAGCRGVAHVAEHHGLHVDRRAPIGGDIVQLPIGDGARVHPRPEHGPDGAPQLLVRILRERLVEGLLDQPLVELDDSLKRLRVEVGVQRRAALLALELQDRFELVVIDAEHHVPVHLDEAAVGVPGEARLGRRGERVDGLVVEAEIEHRVHHAGHGGARPGAHRDEQRLRPVAENPAGQIGDRAERRFHLLLEVGRIGAVVGGEPGADFGRDGEAGGNGEPEARHLGKVGALAAQKLLHLRGAVSLAAAERVNPFRHEPPLNAMFALFLPRWTPCLLLARTRQWHNR